MVLLMYLMGSNLGAKILQFLLDNPFSIQIVFSDRGEIISAGNFHGEYPAKALDYLAIGVHELAAMSERRVERLVNPGNFLSFLVTFYDFG
jgi:histidine ammonia-lyase